MDPISVLLAALFLAWLFVTAGWHKLRDPIYYAGIIEAYRLPLLRGSKGVAVVIGGVELIIAAALLVPSSRPAAAMVAACLLALYGVAIGINILRGKTDIDCGCSGPLGKQPISGWLLWRNGVLVLMAFCAGASMSVRSLGWLDWVVILMGSLSAVLLYQVGERLLSNSHLLIKLRS